MRDSTYTRDFFNSTILWMERNVSFNYILTQLFLRLYSVGHKVKDHLDSKRGNPLPPFHGLLFLISSKGSFIFTVPQTGEHIPSFCYTSHGALDGSRNSSTMRDQFDNPLHQECMVYHRATSHPLSITQPK